MEADGADVAGSGDGLEFGAPLLQRVAGEVLVEPASESASAVIRWTPAEVQVRQIRPGRRDESDQEGGQPVLVLKGIAVRPVSL